MTRRAATGGTLWASLAADRGTGGLVMQTVDPLDLLAIDAILTTRLGRRLPVPVVRRIHAASGGNPLYALAIGREVNAHPGPGSDLPIPRTLTSAMSGRLRDVGVRAADPLLAVAAASHATLALVHAVVDGFTVGDLDAAVAGEILEIAGDRVRFTHPLLASTHYASTSASRRRAMHRRLAAAIDEPQQRARHLALGAEAPAQAVAAAIDDGAAAAAARGAPEIAAELLEAAARLTPAENVEARHARFIQAAELHHASGNLLRSREMLSVLMPELVQARLRARAMTALAASTNDFDAADALLADALTHAHDDPSLQARILQERSSAAANRGEFRARSTYAQAALAAARLVGDPGLLARGMSEMALADFFTGQRVEWAALSQAVDLEDPAHGSSRESPSGSLALILFWSDDHEPGRRALKSTIQRARERGEQYILGALQFELGLLEWYAGNVEEAERLHAASRQDGSEQGDLMLDMWLTSGDAMFAARRGDFDHARAAAHEATTLTHAINDRLMEAFPIMVLASIDLWTGRPDKAHEQLYQLRERLVARGFGCLGAPFLDMWTVDIEALITLGRFDEAQQIVDDLSARAETVGNPNATAIAARCHGLLLAARADVPGALAWMDAALAAHEERLLRPELARTLLERGTILRRAKQKNAAKQTLERALPILDEIGATMLAARARDELQRVGLRREAQQQGLTPAQARVVDLVCAGMSNQQIADTLYMSVRSVESHLTKAYREYGVRSRAQLVVTLAGQPTGRRIRRLDPH